jgi:hypothetical protein
VVTFALTTSEYLVKGSRYTVVAGASAANSGGVSVTEQDSTVSDVSTRPTDVSVTTYSTPKIKPGKRGYFSATVTNHGPHRAHGVALKQTVPKGFYWKNVKGRAIVARTSRTLTIQVGTLEVGQAVKYYGYFSYPVGASLEWTSRVAHTDPDSRTANNAASSSTRVLGPLVKGINTSNVSGPDSAVSTTSTTISSSTTSATNAAGLYGSNQSSADTSSSAKEQLADTGGPALRLPVMGLTLVLLGSLSSASSRRRRAAPRHRAWISPYA